MREHLLQKPRSWRPIRGIPGRFLPPHDAPAAAGLFAAIVLTTDATTLTPAAATGTSRTSGRSHRGGRRLSSASWALLVNLKEGADLGERRLYRSALRHGRSYPLAQAGCRVWLRPVAWVAQHDCAEVVAVPNTPDKYRSCTCFW